MSAIPLAAQAVTALSDVVVEHILFVLTILASLTALCAAPLSDQMQHLPQRRPHLSLGVRRRSTVVGAASAVLR